MRDDWQVIEGDCLDVMAEMEPGSVDAVVTDPPYCSGARTAAAVRGRGGMSRKALWNSAPLDGDQMTSVGFVWLVRQMAIAARRLLVDGGSLLSFVDWRSYPNAYAAIETANLRIQTMIVWDKETIALGNGFRNQHELIIHAARGVPNIYSRATPNVLRVQRIQSSDIHPTEKPRELMAALIEVVSPRGGLILDPFCGSGTTGVACAELGRRFCGIEVDPGYCEIARARIDAATRQQRLPLDPAPVPEQTELL